MAKTPSSAARFKEGAVIVPAWDGALDRLGNSGKGR
jgi:hypothetical protein